jgi:septal ring factor EnvC (AmiA/AmiB activator)
MVEVAVSVQKNPIRRVVTMIQSIKKKVEAEGERDLELHEKFMCYCKNGANDLAKSIAASEAKIAGVGSALEEAAGQTAQLKKDLASHKADRAAAKEAIAKATAIRAGDAKSFAASKAESETNIAALVKAVASIEKGTAGSFLQTGAAQAVRQIVIAKDMPDIDRQDLMAFLENGVGASGQILGILKQLGDEMNADLKDATAAEEAAIQSFDELVAAKSKEIDALTLSIEEKSTRLGETGVSMAQMGGDSGDASDSLADDKKFLAEMKKTCATAQDTFDAVVKSRNAELLALSDTINMLNSDEALELFKKAIPSAASSFMQLTVSARVMQARALAMIKAAHSPRFDFIALALHGKKMGFDKVVAMIDDMVVNLKKEQEDDNSKKEYCEKEFDTSEDKKKELERALSDSNKAIADADETLATLAEEIKALTDGIKALDTQVAESTAQRQAENAEYKSLMASDTAAKELIGMAKNRLNKFYNPKLYKAPPKRELSEEERIAVNNGETLAPTPAPGGISGTGITALEQNDAEPAPAPQAVAGPSKKSEEGQGVIALLDLLVQDLDKEMTVAEVDEKDAQADYETAMEDSKKKRADDAKSIDDKNGAKAASEGELQNHKDSKASLSNELRANGEYIAGLHGECDWLLQNFDSRKEARAGEIDALGKAKAVLNGADYSLLQTGARRSLRGHQ